MLRIYVTFYSPTLLQPRLMIRPQPPCVFIKAPALIPTNFYTQLDRRLPNLSSLRARQIASKASSKDPLPSHPHRPAAARSPAVSVSSP